VPGTGNGGVMGHFPYEQTAEVFVFTVNSGTFTNASQIGNVAFQYGTQNAESTSSRNNGTAIVTSASPTTGTVPTTLNDTAVLSSTDNSVAVAGSITFTLYDPSNTVVYTETDPVSAASGWSPISVTTTGPGTGSRVATTAGTYQWVASFTSSN